MKVDPQNPRRRSTRLKGYDYSLPGAYFVTIVTWQRACLFGEIVDGEMQLNESGKIVEKVWGELPLHYRNVESGAFCIMPNHVHAVIILNETGIVRTDAGETGFVGEGLRPSPTPAETNSARNNDSPCLTEIVRAFKSFSARRINELRQAPSRPVWQRTFYDHIIRNHEELKRIHLYIEANPANWLQDEENHGQEK